MPCISDYLHVDHITKIEDARMMGKSIFYKATTEEGNKLYVSTGNIRRSQFADIVDNAENEITIISGAHGNMDGELILEMNGIKGESLLEEDIDKWGISKNITIYDVSKLSEGDLTQIISSSKDTVCAWCFIERAKIVIDAVNKNSK